MIQINHEEHMRRAISLAMSARAHRNHPFGALLVIGKKAVLEAENTVLTDNDPTQHAELRLLSQASRKLSKTKMRKAVLYASTEPCAMCSGAIVWAGVRNVVFGCTARELGRLAGGRFVVGCEEIFSKSSESVGVVGPILETEAVEAHEGFW